MADQLPGVALVRRTGQNIINDLQTKPNQLALGLQEAQQQGLARAGLERFLKGAAALVFAYWSAKYDHPRALLDTERERCIMKRLRESEGDVSELMYALDGGLRDAWVMGTDRRADHKNDGILFIFASRERVEKLAERCGGYKRGEKHKMVVKYIDQHMNGNGASNGKETTGTAD